MLRINLLPDYRNNTKLPTWKLYRIFAYIFLSLCILLWGYYLALFKYSESKLNKVNEDITSLQIWQERFDKAQIENAKINQRNDIIRNLAKNRIIWSNSLKEFGNATPDGCWLTSIKPGRKQEIILINGKALKIDDVIEFINVLQRWPDVADVQLLKASENTSDDVKTTDFALEVKRSGVKK